MSLPSPVTYYDLDNDSVVARGVFFTDEQLTEMLAGPVKDLLLDSKGKTEVEEMLASLASTDFETGELAAILEPEHDFEDWLIGEAIAEVFVCEFCACEYPWPTSRDLKNPKSSPAGCDMTGFQVVEDQENPYRFSFGEVKTSADASSPPSVMNSLEKQIIGLRDSSRIKTDLVRYLAFHSKDKDWEHKFRSSFVRYTKSKYKDIAIFGVLVRDTKIKETDIGSKIERFSDGCPDGTSITIYALYIPDGLISDLPDRVQMALDEDGAS